MPAKAGRRLAGEQGAIASSLLDFYERYGKGIMGETGKEIKTDKKRNWKREGWVIALTFAYFLLHLVLIARHESWRDEAYVWVVLRNGSIGEIWKEMMVVGHPCLWFVWLYPFVKLGMPFAWMGIASLLPMTLAAYLFLRDESLPLPLRLLTICSPVFAFYNAVVARPYCLSVLLMVLLMRLWRERRERPFAYAIVAVLLSWTHVIFAGFCGGLLLELFFSKENKTKKKAYAACGVLLAGLLLFVLQLWQFKPSESSKPMDLSTRLEYITPEHFIEGIRSVFLYNGRFVWPVLFVLLIVAVLYFAVSAWKKGKKQEGRGIIPVFFGVVFFLLVVCFLRPVEHPQMAGCLLLILLFLFHTVSGELRVQKTAEKLLAMVFLTVFAVSAYKYTLHDVWADCFGDYSGSRDAAEYIMENLPEGAVLGLEEMQDTEAPYAYLADIREDLRYYNVWKKEDWSYYRWMKCRRPEPVEVVSELRGIRDGKEAYYLSRKELDAGEDAELVYQSSAYNVWYEDYYLYRIR